MISIETILSLLGLSMYATPLIIVNIVAMVKLAEFIEPKTPQKFRDYTFVAVGWLWLVLGLAVMAVVA